MRTAFFLLIAALPCAAERWIEMRSAHFGIFTDAETRTGREVLERLEQIHRLFSASVIESARSPIPVRVFLFSSEAGFLPYRPNEAATGFYQPAPECNYILMRLAGADTWRIVYHEYVHLALRHAGPPLPYWFEEGTAEFYSTLDYGPSRLSVGLPIPGHLRTLAAKNWLAADTLASVNRESPYYNERANVGIFYAQSWALVHMLNLSPSYRDGMSRFAVLIGEGKNVPEAFRLAFGKTMAGALEDLSRYVALAKFHAVEIAQPPAESIALSEPRELSNLESRLLKAQLLCDTGKPAAAEQAYRRIARKNPSNPDAEAGLGILALSRRSFQQAQSHLARAIELGSRQARTYFEYAMLLRDTGADREQVLSNLHKAVMIDSDFADAQFLLGTILAADGNHAQAAEHLSKAASILPRQASFWHALALSCHQLGRDVEARHAAQRALQAAVTEQEMAMARAAMRLADAPAQSASTKRPAVLTPKSWEAKQRDSSVEGTLQHIDCLGELARFHIRSGTSTIALSALKPKEIQIKSAVSRSFEFRCGPQTPVRVIVEYLARSDANLSTAGDIVSIKFK